MLGIYLAMLTLVEKDIKEAAKVLKKGDGLSRPDRIKTIKDNKPRFVAEDPKDDDIYNFKDSEIGNSWLIGTDSYVGNDYPENEADFANAYKGGANACPENITVPRTLTREGVTKSVEVIGKAAFYSCGNSFIGQTTRYILVTKQVKVIKKYGFGNMEGLLTFHFEDGSVLEKIEEHGLDTIGYNTGSFDFYRITLTLPSTLSLVAENGIYQCHLFRVIIYCGTHNLDNRCELEDHLDSGGLAVPEIQVLVTDGYPEFLIFGRLANKYSQTEVEEHCSLMEMRIPPTLTPTPYPTPLPTPTPSCNCPRSPLKKTTFALTALFFDLLPPQSLFSSISTSLMPDLPKLAPSFSVTFSFPFT